MILAVKANREYKIDASEVEAYKNQGYKIVNTKEEKKEAKGKTKEEAVDNKDKEKDDKASDKVK